MSKVYVWVNIIGNDTLPEAGKEVLFSHEENPPMYGRIKYNGKHPCIITIDSSGEENYHDVKEFSKWLSEESGYRQGWMEDVREVLNDCADYMDNRKDADYEGEVYVPNREMILFSSITDVLEPLPYAPGENSGKEILVIGKTPYDEWLDKDEENSEPKNK